MPNFVTTRMSLFGTLLLLSSCGVFRMNQSGSSSNVTAPSLATISLALDVSINLLDKTLNPILSAQGVPAGGTVAIFSDSLCATPLGSVTALNSSTFNFHLPVPYGSFNFFYKLTVQGASSGCKSSSIAYSADFTNGIGFPLGRLDATFGDPNALSVDRNGNLFVADANTLKIQKFNSAGVWQLRFGAAGSANGQFSYGVGGIATDSAGNIYASDPSGHRVQKFASDGTFLLTWGNYGTGNGQFAVPTALAIDSTDGVYALDSQNYRVEKFDVSGNFILAFGSNGSGNGQFSSYATSIAVDSHNNLYVADTGNNRIQKFDSQGNFVSVFVSSGSTDGFVNGPISLSIDSSNNLYVVDGTNRIQTFNAAGQFVSQFTPPASTDSVSVDPTGGDLYTSSSYGQTVVRFTNAGVLKLTMGSAGSVKGQFNNSTGLQIDPNGNLLVADTGNFRVQKFSPTGVYLLSAGSGVYGNTNGSFQSIYNIATDSAGNIYVGDVGRVQKFDSNGHFIMKFGINGAADGQFSYPNGLAVDSSGNIYVNDYVHYRIEKFDSSGNFLLKFGSQGSGNGQFGAQSSRMKIDQAGNLYVLDGYNQRVQKFDGSGNYLASFGNGAGFVGIRGGLAIDTFGNVYVAGYYASSVQKFDPAGTLISTFGQTGENIGQLNYPTDIAIDSSNNIYICEGSTYTTYGGGHNRVQKFDSNFNPLLH